MCASNSPRSPFRIRVILASAARESFSPRTLTSLQRIRRVQHHSAIARRCRPTCCMRMTLVMSRDTAVRGVANAVIRRPAADVFAAISDISRMGEWSPECVAGRWVAPATGPAVSAVFEGDNVAAVGPVTLKKWTTSSTVTVCEPSAVFEFVAEGYRDARARHRSRHRARTASPPDPGQCRASRRVSDRSATVARRYVTTLR